MTWTLLVGGYLLLALAALAVFSRLVRTRRGLPTAPPEPLSRRRYERRVCADCGRTVAVTAEGLPIARRHRCHIAAPKGDAS